MNMSPLLNITKQVKKNHNQDIHTIFLNYFFLGGELVNSFQGEIYTTHNKNELQKYTLV